MRKIHKTNNFIFTGKHHSKRGIAGLVLAVLSIVGGIAMVVVSFQNQGNGSVYLGSGGILSMILALAAFILSVSGLREENCYRVLPAVATVTGLLALGGWIAVYVLGFLMA